MAVNKRSRQREALVQILSATDSHPTAEWVYDKMRKKFSNVSLATVYRNLRYMVDTGLARELYTNNSSRFDANMEEHYHFICKKCEKVIDIYPNRSPEQLEYLEKSGFFVDRYDLCVYGTCSACTEVTDSENIDNCI